MLEAIVALYLREKDVNLEKSLREKIGVSLRIDNYHRHKKAQFKTLLSQVRRRRLAILQSEIFSNLSNKMLDLSQLAL